MVQKIFAILLITLFLFSSGAAVADDETNALFEQAAAELLTPKAEALQTGVYSLRPSETAYVPNVAPEIIPADDPDSHVTPAVDGTFESSNPAIVSVDKTGLMTAAAEGEATITCHTSAGDVSFSVTVSANTLPESAKAMVYVAKNEFYTTKRARLPKYNKYAKWYYGKKKEVGWCSVFTIWCANASGNRLLKEEALKTETVTDSDIVYFREGQVGNQYDCFQSLGRFTGVPRPGYTVIYGDLDNSYRTTHIGIVVDVADRGEGIYQVTTVEGNMSNSVKSYCYLYDSNADNHTVGVEKGKRLQKNMSALPSEEQTDPLVQYKLHTDHWCVFGYGASWL
ncbi:MAG: Ig-like domain-containing protein [Eubacteriales bacterium]|nr:Ig-like domain-containing protein [Eubacteriales bacterium]